MPFFTRLQVLNYVLSVVMSMFFQLVELLTSYSCNFTLYCLERYYYENYCVEFCIVVNINAPWLSWLLCDCLHPLQRTCYYIDVSTSAFHHEGDCYYKGSMFVVVLLSFVVNS